MKALILSVAAGGGHGNAAEAIKSYINLSSPNSEVKIIDTLKYINPMIDKVVIGSYLNTIKITPSLFGKLYYHAESDYGLSSISSKFNEIMTSKLLPLIEEFKPEILVCTHPFPTEMVSIMKSKYNICIPTVSILTDYAPHSFWLHPYIDAYIVSNLDMIEEMVDRGIPRDIIYNLGIPVKPDFLIKYDRNKTLEEMNLSPNRTTILVMGGSLGMGKISNIYENLTRLDEDIQIIVITGKNKKLYSELTKLQEYIIKPTRIIGFTDAVNKYMQASDLLLTKPGGLTVTEALVCKIPLGIFSPIPGQEEKNSEFLLRHNLAVDLGNGKNSLGKLEFLISSEKKLSRMRQNCLKYSKPNAGNDIYNLLNSLLKNGTRKLEYSSNEKYYLKNSSNKLFKSLEKLLIAD